MNEYTLFRLIPTLLLCYFVWAESGLVTAFAFAWLALCIEWARIDRAPDETTKERT